MTTGIDSKILKKLETWEEKEGPIPESLEFYGKLLHIQSTAKARIGVPEFSLSTEVISDRITTGRPLLEFSDISVDWSLFRDTFEEVSALLSSYSKVWGEVAANLKFSASFLEEAARAWFEGTQLPLSEAVGDANEDLWGFIIHATFKPFLVSYREALYNLINQELWRRGSCPICGGNPDFAFLEKEHGARWLICSRCDAGWLFQRLECPHCGNQDQNTLAYFTDDKGLYRLYVCEQCRHYLKAIDLRQTEDEVLLPLERFLTLDLDIQAQKNGYKPPERVSGGGVAIKEDS